MLDLGTLIDQLGSWVASHLVHIAVTLVVSAWAGPPIADLVTHFFDGVAKALGILATGLHERLLTSVGLPGRARERVNGLFDGPFFWPWRALRSAISFLWSKILMLPRWQPDFLSVPDTIYGAVLDAVTPRVTQAAGGLAQAFDGTMGNLRSKGDGRGVGQPIVGAILLGGAVLAFLYADIVIGLETFWAVFYGRELPSWANVMPEWLRDPSTGHVVASTVTALALGFLIFDLLGITHLNDNRGMRTRCSSALLSASRCGLRPRQPGARADSRLFSARQYHLTALILRGAGALMRTCLRG